MPAKPLTPEQKADASRLMALFKQQVGVTQASLADDLGFANQSAVSQYLNGKIPLNVEAAVKFAGRFRCAVSDFSPSIQKEIDRIASFSTESGDAMKKLNLPFATGEVVSNATPMKFVNTDNLAPKAPSQREVVIGGMYAIAPEESRAAIDVILLKPDERAMLRESGDGSMAISAIDILERTATSALSALSERKKAKNGTKSD